MAGVASSWGALAVAALLQLWDRQLSFAGHAQLMAVMTDYLDCLQVYHCVSPFEVWCSAVMWRTIGCLQSWSCLAESCTCRPLRVYAVHLVIETNWHVALTPN